MLSFVDEEKRIKINFLRDYGAAPQLLSTMEMTEVKHNSAAQNSFTNFFFFFFLQGAAESAKKHQKLLEHLASQKRARELVIPTDDRLVQLRLRELSQPIKLFGESKAGRRERLRTFMAEHGIEQGMPEADSQTSEGPAQEDLDQKKEQFFYPGHEGLVEVRKALIHSSLERANKRLCESRSKRKLIEEDIRGGIVDRFTLAYAKTTDSFRKVVSVASEVGGPRPLSSCAFRGDMLAVSSWEGSIRVYNSQTLCGGGSGSDSSSASVWYARGAHGDRAQHVTWLDDDTILSCGADNVVKVWRPKSSPSDGDITPASVLEGHRLRVNRVVAHPNHRLCVSTSFDSTWRLWDVENHRNLSAQEGHTGAIYGCTVHPDGSLVSTTGMDGLCRLWDIRVGTSVMALKGHVRMVLCADFSPNGHTLASGGDDNTVRVWDMRKKSVAYVLPAHSSTISHVRYHSSGDVLATCSFDKSVKLWGTRDYSNLNMLFAHDSRVTYCDFHPTKVLLASTAFDKTIKFWGC